MGNEASKARQQQAAAAAAAQALMAGSASPGAAPRALWFISLLLAVSTGDVRMAAARPAATLAAACNGSPSVQPLRFSATLVLS